MRSDVDRNFVMRRIHVHIHTHISDTVQTVYELPSLPNNTVTKKFYTILERCEVLTGYLSVGPPAWR